VCIIFPILHILSLHVVDLAHVLLLILIWYISILINDTLLIAPSGRRSEKTATRVYFRNKGHAVPAVADIIHPSSSAASCRRSTQLRGVNMYIRHLRNKLVRCTGVNRSRARQRRPVRTAWITRHLGRSRREDRQIEYRDVAVISTTRKQPADASTSGGADALRWSTKRNGESE
jgi:hypothetical protein